MPKKTLPLYYALIKHFEAGGAYCAQDLMVELAPTYGGYKLFTKKDIEEALATAKENALLDEVGFNIDDTGTLRISYALSAFGKEMLARYLAD